MAKIFYTEHDIDDMKARGVTSLEVHDGIVLTDLAVERAFKHGIQLKRVQVVSAPKPATDSGTLAQRVKAAVLAKLDGQVDAALLDAVIARVLAGMQ